MFRIAFGVAMTVNVLLYLPYLVHEHYIAPGFSFGYPPLEFVRPLPGPGMYAVYTAMGLLGLCIAAGLWYRASCAVFCALTTYVFLLDSGWFQNHEYLISLLSFLMIFLPLHRRWSLDARRRPEVGGRTIPAWMMWLLRFQIAVPYFFGGVAKINHDWLRGEPLRMWLTERTHVQLIGPLFEHEPVVWFMTYGSLVFDLVVVGFLLHPRTRPYAFAVALCFHLLNARLFGLYVFPWLMIAATTLFFRPDWPERLGRWTRSRFGRRPGPGASPHNAPGPVGAVGAVGSFPGDPAVPGIRPDRSPHRVARTGWVRGLVTGCLALWVLVQVLLPLRHLVLPGTVNWTEEGHRFAWHMMLRAKQGEAEFRLSDGERVWRADPSAYLTPAQERLMAGHPERLALFARHLSREHDDAEVRVVADVSLNGREPAPLVDPEVDLARVPIPRWGAAEWILPLEEPLRRADGG
ncbi:HTTM domain-containing protein [Streptomyces sp. ST2-7A]|nr:HTTM domain-containing protein [Streptomyces sp. ST2-7A]MCE7079170.1 HTTM domain-containing protein [Streptomyces sp. ST2-7A]